jgi:hypothetical protein
MKMPPSEGPTRPKLGGAVERKKVPQAMCM